MADKNIQMTQRNAANNAWDNLYPITKVGNLAEGAAGILNAIKTVDGAGSGLDADTVRGKYDFMSNAKIYGNVTYSEGLSPSSTVTKTIALGGSYSHGQVIVKNNNSGALSVRGFIALVGTDSTKTLGVGYAKLGAGAHYGSAWSRRVAGAVTNPSTDSYDVPQFGAGSSGHAYIGIDNLYISGSNLVIVFRNSDSSTNRSIECVIDWEVW